MIFVSICGRGHSSPVKRVAATMKTLLILLAVAAPLFVFAQNETPPAEPPAKESSPKYVIAVDGSPEGLVRKVEGLMLNGYHPAGGVDVEAGRFYQSMTLIGARRRIVLPVGEK